MAGSGRQFDASWGVSSVKHVLAAGLAAAVVLGSVGAALAHGKVGLWSITVTMKSSAMPDIAKMSPQAQAQLRQMGLFNGKGTQVTGQHCMTAAEVAVNDFSAAQRKDKTCKIVSQKISGGAMEADMVCSGDLKGKGHMKFVFDSDTHYFGQMTMTGMHGSQPVNNNETFEGHWVKADCAGVKT
jgi:Protein of unknown function (DUF3617)